MPLYVVILDLLRNSIHTFDWYNNYWAISLFTACSKKANILIIIIIMLVILIAGKLWTDGTASSRQVWF